MTIIFERRKVNDKELVVQFQFASHDIKVNGSAIDAFSLDKYLALEVWSQIYTKLESPLEEFGKNVETKPKDDKIQMRRAQLELQVMWIKTQPWHKEIARVERKDLSLCKYVMVVKVVTVSLIDKYKRQHSQEKLSQKSVKDTQQKSDGGDGSARSSSDSALNSNVDEYVPEARNNIGTSLAYTPATLSNSTEKNASSDEYTPLTKIADDEIVTYTPTKIGHDKEEFKYKPVKRTDVNRNDFLEKKKRTEDLFGGDSDESSNQHTTSSINLRSANKMTPLTASKVAMKQQKTLPDSWVTTRSSSKPQIQNGVTDEVNRKRKIDVVSSCTTSHAKYSSLQSTQDEESKKLRALREKLEAEEANLVSVDVILDLKKMSGAQLVNTYEEHEKELTKIWRTNCSTPDYRINRDKNDQQFLLILDGLVDQKQQVKMYTKLRETFCKSSTDEITTNHENLLWQIMIPEWALLIFMDENIFSRDEALKRLKLQDQAKLDSEYDFI